MLETLQMAFNSTFVVIFALATVFTAPIAYYRRKHQGVSQKGESLLLGFYMQGNVIGTSTSQVSGDLRYSMFVVPNTQALICRIELPFVTRLHLVGIPKRQEVVQLDPTKGALPMEVVDLEGDYNNYFTLFADSGQQSEARYALDPQAMAFTVDFCRSHSWEIVNNELYFVQIGGDSSDDSTSMFADIATFVKQIRPAIEKPLSAAEIKNLTPYAEERRRSLPCPICASQMTYDKNHFACPQGHGVLISGRVLHQYNKGKVVIPVRSAHAVEHGTLTCPSCGTLMQHAVVSGSTDPIDSCLNCPYRWLDVSELRVKS